MSFLLALLSIGVLGTVVVSQAADPKTSTADSTELQTLNQDYVRSVVVSNVGWFEKNLGADFVCTNADGSLVDRVGFLKQTAPPVAVSNVEVHDVSVRVMGDFALIHART